MFLFWIALGVGLAFSIAFIGWRSLESLRQARVLRSPISASQAPSHVGRIVALRGQVRCNAARRVSGTDVLWCGSWHAPAQTNEFSRFEVAGGPEPIHVRSEPTEVYGCWEQTEKLEPAALDGLHVGAHHHRRTVTLLYLPVPPELTVVGRLIRTDDTRSLEVVADRRTGFLWSPALPRDAANREFAKGVLGLGIAGAFLAVGAFIAFYGIRLLGS